MLCTIGYQTAETTTQADCLLAVACSEGGTSIEDLAEKFPEKILKIPVDIRTGITDEQAMQMAKGLAVTGDIKAAAQQIKNLYKLFTESDCTMVEVSGQCYWAICSAKQMTVAESSLLSRGGCLYRSNLCARDCTDMLGVVCGARVVKCAQ